MLNGRLGFRMAFVLAAVLTGLLISGCSGSKKKTQVANNSGSSSGGFFGGDKPAPPAGGGIGVNSFLWRASLDTISFMPVNSADPFGGVIITEWHSQPQAPNERFKLNVFVLDKTLRADGIRVAVFRQVQNRQGLWKDAAVPGETGTKIEDAILIRARQLRNQSLSK